MNILITGNLSSLATTFVKEFVKRKHRLVLASDDADKVGIKSGSVIVHTINPAADIFRDVMPSYGFDIAIFISTREEQLSEGNDFKTGHQLDGLWNTLELCKGRKLKHFFYISSTEVYGKAKDLSEKATPEPSSLNGHTLLAGEQYCQIYHDKFSVNISIVRITNIYGPDERSGLLYRIIAACNDNGEIILPICEHASISLLHAEDIADFVIRAIDEEYTSEAQIINLCSSNPLKYSELAQHIQTYYPQAIFRFLDEGLRLG
jgi:nucleoside-diphosphate-sugar epimerase